MTSLLNPKVHFVYRRFLTEDKMLSLLKKFKQKKYGMKIYAVDVEEVELTKEQKQIWASKANLRFGHVTKLKPGTYFHLRIEYVV